MKKYSIETILDQKKGYSHVIFLLVASIVGIYNIITNEGEVNLQDQLGYTFLTFAFIETFIFLGKVIFNHMIIDITSKKFLINILLRFLFFYVVCFIAAFILSILSRYYTYYLNDQDVNNVITNFIDMEFNSWFISVAKGLTFGAVIFIFIQLSESLKKGRQLKRENLIFQNETLKNQINPHFLFNSLNTLSSLIRPNPDLAEMFIHKFSGIYRYILDNIKKDKVPLELELDFVSDFFELHKIRDEDKIIMNIDRKDAELYWIPPVSLQILVENAIKHNMATKEKPLSILIYIENNQMIVRNNLQKMAHQLASTQTGLKNLNERIKLISNKELIIEETMSDFIVKLPLLS